MSHAALEQRVVIDCRRGDLFIRPTGEYGDDGRLDGTPNPSFTTTVIAHACRNSGKCFRHIDQIRFEFPVHKSKNPLPASITGSGSEDSFVICVYSSIALRSRITIAGTLLVCP